ncbi:CLUMA_CG010481, isoform A [Clunio marinus]|uniref:CLUMA_CG010481, isoform A n=1 Tax=Clunio marinus TaxID=568069 RepID=A0A1J1I9W5_9DIPT|nr:CLUMA_CG010481, isoform A [Clunio marinus]
MTAIKTAKGKKAGNFKDLRCRKSIFHVALLMAIFYFASPIFLCERLKGHNTAYQNPKTLMDI